MPNTLPRSISTVTDTETLNQYQSFTTIQQKVSPSISFKPTSITQVKELVLWANKTNTPLIPVSSTGKHRREDTSPTRLNSAIVDLTGMRQLIHVDARDKIAIFEPGIDFGSADQLLKDHGLRVYRPLKPRAGKSVITSYLEREPLINPNDHWDVADPFGGTSIVLGNGDLVLTGSAAIEGTLEEQLARGHRHMFAPGPTNIDLLKVLQGAQGSLGIMTWAALYCERIPTAEESWFASANHLHAVIGLAKKLLHRRIGSTLFIVDNVKLALLISKNEASFLKNIQELPAWNLFVTLTGNRHLPQDKINWQRNELKVSSDSFGIQSTDALNGYSASQLDFALRQSGEQHFRDHLYGEHLELFYLQQLSKLPKAIEATKQFLSTKLPNRHQVGTYIQPMAQGTYCHVEHTLPLSRSALLKEETTRNWGQTAEVCAKYGGFFSRPYGAWQQLAFSRSNGHQQLLKTAKKIMDPNSIMNPGRIPYGSL